MKPEIVTGWTAVFAVLVAADPLLAPLGLGKLSADSPARTQGSARTRSVQGMSSRLAASRPGQPSALARKSRITKRRVPVPSGSRVPTGSSLHGCC